MFLHFYVTLMTGNSYSLHKSYHLLHRSRQTHLWMITYLQFALTLHLVGQWEEIGAPGLNLQYISTHVHLGAHRSNPIPKYINSSSKSKTIITNN